MIRYAAIIFAALTTPALAGETCRPTEDIVAANLAHCDLHINGKTVVNGGCQISVAHDGRSFQIAEPTSNNKAEVDMIPTRSDLPHALYGFWNRGSKSDTAEMVNYGKVGSVDMGKKADSPWCWRNSRFSMCISAPYLICNHGADQ